MLNTVTAHIKFIEGNDVLRKVIPDIFINAKFARNRILRCQQIANLDIKFLILFVTDKVDFFISGFADCYRIATADFPLRRMPVIILTS